MRFGLNFIKLYIKRKLNIVFYPQTDGKIEKQYQTLEHYYGYNVTIVKMIG